VPPTDDRALIDEAQRGSAAAFEELVRRHDRSVLRLALGLLRSEEDARDVYQETFLRAYRSLGEFRGASSLRTWVLRIATNLCLDHLRRASSRPEEAGRARGTGGPGDGEADGPAGDPAMRLADDRPAHDPERALASREARRRIAAALGGLPTRERLVFELRHYEGLRLREIGDILETSEETARNCLFRAHRDLRAALGDLRDPARGPAAGRNDPARAGT